MPSVPAQPRYGLLVTQRQAQLIENAMDLYARLLLGQTEVIEALARDGYVRHQLRARHTEFDEIKLACEALKHALTGHAAAESFGIFHPRVHDSARVAWDLAKVVRHGLAWDRHPAGGPGGEFEKPYQTSVIEPLATIARSTVHPSQPPCR